MRIEIRPLLRGKSAFTVDIDPSKTIADLKLRISTEEGYPAETQNIILSGRSLQDDKTIGTCDIQPKKYLVLILKSGPKGTTGSTSTIKNPSTAPSKPVTPPPASTSRPVPVPAPPPPQPLMLGQQPMLVPTLNGTGISSNTPMPASQTAIDSMMELGFPRDQVERALRASFGNPERAVEYLFEGIPAHLDSGSAPTVTASQASNLLANLMSRPTPNATATQNSGPTQLPNPQDLLQLITQQQQQQRQQQPRSLDDSSSMLMRGMGGVGGGLGGLSGLGGMSGLGAPVGMAGSGGLGSIGGPDGDDGSAVEIEPAQVEEIRRLVAYNPTLIRPLVAQIKEQEPDLAADLTEDPETVLRFFSQGTDGNGSSDDRDVPIPAGPTAGPTALQPVSQGSRLTLADEASIDKLQAVGYKRENVVQAFLSCGKNEQAAANLLADWFQNGD